MHTPSQPKARWRRSALALAWLVASMGACADDPGELQVELRWSTPPGTPTFLWARVEDRWAGADRRGEVLAETPAGTPYSEGSQVQLRLGRVPNGHGRVLIVESRRNSSVDSQVVHRGASAPFSMAAGQRSSVSVTLEPVAALAQVVLELRIDDVPNPLRATSEGLREAELCVFSRGVQRLELAPADDFADIVVLEVSKCGGAQAAEGCGEPPDPDLIVCSLPWDLTRHAAAAQIAHSVFLRAYDRFDAALPVLRRTVLRDDEAPHVLAATVTPAEARAGSEVTVLLSVHEPLDALASRAHALAVGPGGAGLVGPRLAGPERVGRTTSYVWRATIDDDAPEGTFGLAATLVDELGNRTQQALVDREGAPLTLRVDRTPVALVPGSVELSARHDGVQRGSYARDGAALQVRFALRGAAAPGGVVLLVGELALTDLQPTEPGGGRYLVNYVVRDARRCGEVAGELCLDEGPQPVTLDVRDDAGNRTSAPVGTLMVDFSPPAVAAGTELVGYRAGPGNGLVGLPERATVGSAVDLRFSLDEPGSVHAVEVSEPAESADAFSVQRVGEDTLGVQHHFEATLQRGDVTQGAHVFAVDAEDRAGNRGSAPLSVAVQVDTQVPPAPGVEVGTLLYRRTPWGAEGTDGSPRFGLVGLPGAVEPGATLITYNAAEPDERQELGRRRADDQGALGSAERPLELPAFDLPRVYVLAEDAAGNRSEAVPVRDVLWTATLGGKLAGSTRQNPHRFVAGARHLSQRSQGLTTELGAADGLARHGDGQVTTRGTFRWTRRDGARSSPSARYDHAAAVDSARGVTVLFGGFGTAEFGALGDTWELDADGWTLRHTYDPQRPDETPEPRQAAAMAYDSRRGVTVLFGGTDGAQQAALGDTWEFDGLSWTRRQPARSPGARSDHALVYDSGRGVVVLFGGTDDDDEALADTWEYDGQTWTQRRPGRSPQALYRHAMAYDAARGVTVLFGGEFLDWEEWWFGATDETWEYDGQTWTQQHPAAAPSPRSAAAMSYDAIRQTVVLVGGETEDFDVLGDTWELTGDTWARRHTYRQGDAAPAPRRDQTLVYDPTLQRCVVFGGFVSGTGPRETWAWDGDSWSLLDEGGERPFVSPSARLWSQAVYASGQGGVLLFGGTATEGGARGDLWSWDGERWRQLHDYDPAAPDAAPAPRTLHAMAWDHRRQVLVLFGGDPGRGETWEWDGQGWSLRERYDPNHPQGSPAPRYNHAMAYDPRRAVTVLFGGSTDGPAETWEWDAAAWTRRHVRTDQAPDASPPALDSHAMTYDKGRQVVLLHGGWSGALSGQTWEWDGEGWTRRDVEELGDAPPPLRWHSLVYDDARGVAVLFGGGDRGWYLDQTWEWDGRSWTVGHAYDPGLPDDSPLPRAHHAMAYDAARSTAVLFGGEALPLTLEDTWELGGDALGRPVHLFEVAWASAEAPGASLMEVAATWHGGGVGYQSAAQGCDEQAGLQLAVWQQDSWEPLVAGPGAQDAPEQLTWSSDDRDWLQGLPFGASPTLTFAATPTAPNGCGGHYAELRTDYVEVSVRYRLP